MTLVCQAVGHRPAFHVEGRTMRWACDRCGQDAGAKDYDSPDDARRYATVFNRHDTDDLGKRTPIGLLPLRLWRRLRRSR